MPDGARMPDEVHRFFEAPDGVDPRALSTHLDELDPDARVAAVRSLDRRMQARLFEAAQGFRRLALEDLVPSHAPPLTEVVHPGRNSLPVLSSFQKRFCRAAGVDDQLGGYNEHPLRAAIGPGYFLVRPHEEGELLIDYSTVPTTSAAGWPRIQPNSSPRGRLVYHGLEDVLRGVSAHVCVGRATRRGKPMDAWFVLSRVDPR